MRFGILPLAAPLFCARLCKSREEKESAARYVDFTFDPRMPLMTAAGFELRATPKQP